MKNLHDEVRKRDYVINNLGDRICDNSKTLKPM